MTCILFPKVVNSGLKRSMVTSSRLRLRGWVKTPTELTKTLGDVWLAKNLSKLKRKVEPMKTWWWCIRKPLSGRSTTDIKIFNQCKSWFTKYKGGGVTHKTFSFGHWLTYIRLQHLVFGQGLNGVEKNVSTLSHVLWLNHVRLQLFTCKSYKIWNKSLL